MLYDSYIIKQQPTQLQELPIARTDKSPHSMNASHSIYLPVNISKKKNSATFSHSVLLTGKGKGLLLPRLELGSVDYKAATLSNQPLSTDGLINPSDFKFGKKLAHN